MFRYGCIDRLTVMILTGYGFSQCLAHLRHSASSFHLSMKSGVFFQHSFRFLGMEFRSRWIDQSLLTKFIITVSAFPIEHFLGFSALWILVDWLSCLFHTYIYISCYMTEQFGKLHEFFRSICFYDTDHTIRIDYAVHHPWKQKLCQMAQISTQRGG